MSFIFTKIRAIKVGQIQTFRLSTCHVCITKAADTSFALKLLDPHVMSDQFSSPPMFMSDRFSSPPMFMSDRFSCSSSIDVHVRPIFIFMFEFERRSFPTTSFSETETHSNWPGMSDILTTINH